MKNFFQKIAAWFSFNSGPVYDNKGVPYTASQLDGLRGMHTGRSAEQSKFALNLRTKRLNKPVHETYETGHISGSEPIVKDLSAYTTQEVKNLLYKESGSYYTGRVKTYNWNYKGVEYFNCLAEFVYLDEGNFIHVWQGPQPNIGFYNAKTIYKSIEGPEPKIKGFNYEKNT